MSSILRLNVGGQCYTGERWLIGAELGTPFNVPAPTLGDLNEASAHAYNTFLTNVWTAKMAAYNRAGVTVQESRASYYLNGVLTGSIARTETVAAGTSVSATLSGSSALVASKLTSFAGRTQRGRMYLPATGITLETTSGQVPDTAVAQVATWVSDWYEALAKSTWNVQGTGYELLPVVVGVDNLFNASKAIDNVRVDSRLDRQNRRQKNAPSQFTSTVPVIY